MSKYFAELRKSGFATTGLKCEPQSDSDLRPSFHLSIKGELRRLTPKMPEKACCAVDPALFTTDKLSINLARSFKVEDDPAIARKFF